MEIRPLGRQALFNALRNTSNEIVTTLAFQDKRRDGLAGLDGIRGWAALFVMGSHTGVISSGFGATGVWLFFVLSGYLLSRGMERALASGSPWRETCRFYVKRIFRILPIYYLALYVYSLFVWSDHLRLNTPLFVDHVLFIKAQWLFWTIKVEMLFYCILPIIMIVLSLFVNRALRIVMSAVLCGLLYYLTEVLVVVKFQMANASDLWPLYITPFMIGITLGVSNLRLSPKLSRWFLYVSVAMLLILSIDSDMTRHIRELVGMMGDSLPWQNRLPAYLLSGLVIFSAVNNRTLLVENAVIRTLGIIGFSFYLWHMMVVELLRRTYGYEGMALFGHALPIVFFLSVFSCHLIEFPFHSLGKRLARQWPQQGRSRLQASSLN